MKPTPDGKMPGESNCSPRAIQSYLGRISGPLLDRIDLHVEVPSVNFDQITSRQNGESSEEIRKRVMEARRIQQKRYRTKRHISSNARMGSRELKRYCELDENALEMLKHAMAELRLSARAYDRILKVSRTIADLENSESIQPNHLGEAIQYRSLDRQIWG